MVIITVIKSTIGLVEIIINYHNPQKRDRYPPGLPLYNVMTNKTLPKDISTEQLMDIDYRYRYSDEELMKDWNAIKQATVFTYGSQFKPGLKLSQHFCDNFFDIKTKNGKSFLELSKDPILIDKVRTWGLEKMSALYISWIRRAIYMAGGMHNPSHYRPHLAKEIILSTKKQRGVLLDPCAGWGGRMIGTVASGWNYIGFEPNKKTFDNLIRIVSYLNIGDSVILYQLPYDFALIKNKVDIVLTSPPYFDLEIYDDSITQSYNQFTDYDDWLHNWYLNMIKANFDLLKDDGLSCYNVQNGRCKNIVEETINVHSEYDYQLIKSIGINSPFKNYKKKVHTKSDLTYVFKKICDCSSAG